MVPNTAFLATCQQRSNHLNTITNAETFNDLRPIALTTDKELIEIVVSSYNCIKKVYRGFKQNYYTELTTN